MSSSSRRHGRKSKERRISGKPLQDAPNLASPILPQDSSKDYSSDICFGSSFGSQFNRDVISFMDKMDYECSDPKLNLFSTPAAVHTRSSLADKSSSLFEKSTPAHEKEAKSYSSFLVSPFPTNNSSAVQTPVSSCLCLSQWGLPEKVLEAYSERGIETMFKWQAECLSQPGVLSGCNLIYSAPTSAGKTLVAELLALKCVLELRKKAIMILPFVSIVLEKTRYLKELFLPVGVKVGGFMGNQSPHGGFAAADIAICTIERANSLVNRLLEEGRSAELGAVIVDEIHMIGDHHRGYLLELLLTKLLFKIKQSTSGSNDEDKETISTVQIIGMSAVLPNLPILATWLKAALYQTDFRPVPLKEMVKVGPTLYSIDFDHIKTYEGSRGDEEDILTICHEKLMEGHSVVIFCPTKNWCEKLALTISSASFLSSRDCFEVKSSVELDHTALSIACEELHRTPVGLDPVLRKTVPAGVAFHHAGLTYDERAIIENAFRQFHIKILVATSTLSSGVNLPAHLVIIRTPIFHRSLVDIMVYKQMVGRAGRKGMETHGESILMCKPSERGKVSTLLKSAPQPIRSCLGRAPPSTTGKASHGTSHVKKTTDHLLSMSRAVLEVIASGTASSNQDVVTYISCTLLYAELEEDFKQLQGITEVDCSVNTLTQETLAYLSENEFIASRSGKTRFQSSQLEASKLETSEINEDGGLYATQLGVATVASALSPSEALVVFAELVKARKAFVLENELHLVYLVTPVYIQEQWSSIEWYRYLRLLEGLPADMKHVANVIGVQESFLAQAVQGRIPEKTHLQRQRLQIHRRFLAALVLHDLIQEVPMPLVAQKYNVPKGLLQNLQLSSSTFAGMVTVFCSRLGWKNLELLLAQFQSRLEFGIERELCELVQISALSGAHARVLYNAGFHTLTALATANPIAMESCLRKAFPFHSLKDNGGIKKRTIWCSRLRRELTDYELVELIIKEAQKIVSEQLRLPDVMWNVPVTKNDSPNLEKRIKLFSSPSAVSKTEIFHDPALVKTSTETVREATGEQAMVEQNEQVARSSVKPTSEIANSPQALTPLATSRANTSAREASLSSPTFVDSVTNLSTSLFSSPTLAVVDLEDVEKDDHSENPHKASSHTIEELHDFAAESLAYNRNLPQEAKEPMSITDLEQLHSFTPNNLNLTVIDVSSNDILYKNFVSLSSEHSSLSFAFATQPDKTEGIGNTKNNQPLQMKGIPLRQSNKQIVGVAVCFGSEKVYYVTLYDCVGKENVKMESSFGHNPVVPLSSRLNSLVHILAISTKTNVTVFDMKRQAKLMMAATGSELCQESFYCDPVVADWLLDPNAKSKTIHQMAAQYLPRQILVKRGKHDPTSTLCTLATNSPAPYIRAAAEITVATRLMNKLETLLKAEELYSSFCKVEMPTQQLLAKIELNGIGICVEQCSQVQDTLKTHLSQLEQLAYQYAGKHFTLSSSDEVAQVLFVDLNLPSGQEEQSTGGGGVNTRKGRKRRVQHLSTSKDVLAKILHLHPLPAVIIEWRRVFHTLTMTVFPLMKKIVHHECLGCDRVHSTCQLHTATGRVSFTEPNIQNIPKEYEIGLLSSTEDQKNISHQFEISQEMVEKSYRLQTVCMRNVLSASSGSVLLAADYSQLELRILAHLSGDSRLQAYLNSDGDAFRLIAGEWLGILPTQVTDEQRQQTKHLCYGMIYGIGGKALAEQLSVTEPEALGFMEAFKSKFPEMEKFITTTIQQCRANGYITTITGRRRYLPGIHHADAQTRNQAERQAVNSTIQGSGADIVKTAMNNIDCYLRHNKSSTFLCSDLSQPVLLILQLHDELLYEVHESVLAEVASAVRKEMESAIALTVALPVKLKTGKLWGTLQSIKH